MRLLAILLTLLTCFAVAAPNRPVPVPPPVMQPMEVHGAGFDARIYHDGFIMVDAYSPAIMKKKSQTTGVVHGELSCFIDSKGRIYDAIEEDGSHLFIAGCKTSTVFY